MKKNNYIKHIALAALIGISIFTLASCESLDQSSSSQLAEGNVPQNNADAEALINGVYARNIPTSTVWMYLFDLTTETTISGESSNSGAGTLSLFSWDGKNSYMNSAWSTVYEGLARANDVIEKLSGSPAGVSPELASRIIGEAKFFRAYYLNYAVQVWGPVPIVTSTSGGHNAVRSPEREVYKQIVADLEDAAERLPSVSAYSATQAGRITHGAAKSALAKVYLTWAQVDDELTDAERHEYFSKSVQYAQEVINSNEYSLEENFYDNWNNQHRNGKESIYAVQYYIGSGTNAGDNTGGNHLCHCSFSTSFSVDLPHITPEPSNAVKDSYLEGDQRKNVSFADSLWRPSTNSFFHFYYDADGDGKRESGFSRYNKYIDHDSPETSAADRAMNRTVIRYAEVLLILAEAINERDGKPNQEAYDAFNQVRRRAFREDIYSGTPQPHDLEKGLDYNGFRNAIIQERSWEFVLEQKHLPDLKRWKILVKTIKNSPVAKQYPQYNKQNVDFKHYRFPIPQAQRDVNPNLWQNYGYDGSEISANPYVGRE